VGIGMSGLRGLVLAVRFVCELAMLAALAWWGAATFEGAMAFVAGIAAPLAAIVVWGMFVAPKARRPVPVVTRLLIEDVLFALTTLALFAVGPPLLAIVFALAAFTTSALNALPELAAQRRGDAPPPRM
jgi:hypothetical protein